MTRSRHLTLCARDCACRGLSAGGLVAPQAVGSRAPLGLRVASRSGLRSRHTCARPPHPPGLLCWRLPSIGLGRAPDAAARTDKRSPFGIRRRSGASPLVRSSELRRQRGDRASPVQTRLHCLQKLLDAAADEEIRLFGSSLRQPTSSFQPSAPRSSKPSA